MRGNLKRRGRARVSAKQLPEVRSRLDVAENKLNASAVIKTGGFLPLEAKAVLDSMVNIDAQLNELTFKEAEISVYQSASVYRTPAGNVKRWKMKSQTERAGDGNAETQQEIAV